MGDLLRLVCEEKGHVPRDYDPTGGAPWMGGPVLITICDRCGRELPHSDTAKAFNEKVRVLRDEQAARAEEERVAAQQAWENRVRWWQLRRRLRSRGGRG